MTGSFTHQPRERVHGLTLLELMLALAIGVVVLGLLVMVMRGALELWTASSGRLTAAAQARHVLDQVERDLRTALRRADGSVWLAATVLPDTMLSGWWISAARAKPVGSESLRLPPGPPDTLRWGVAGTWLRFFTATSDDGLGAVRAVGYQLIRRELAPDTGEFGYLLHRAEVSAANTFAAGYDLDPLSGGYRQRSATAGHAGNLLRPPLTSVIADHVVDFGVRIFRLQDDDLREVFPANGTEFLARDAQSDQPVVVEVMVRVLDAEGVRRLTAFESGGEAGDGTWWGIVDRHSHVEVRRIALPTMRP